MMKNLGEAPLVEQTLSKLAAIAMVRDTSSATIGNMLAVDKPF